MLGTEDALVFTTWHQANLGVLGTILAPGDTVVLYTDGIVEARTTGGEQFGEERLRALVEHAAGATPEELIVRIVGAVDRHTAGSPPKDDSTLVVLTGGEAA